MTAPHHADHDAPAGHVPAGHTSADWDARYAEEEQIWSGNPNAALVAEVADLTPGTALDVGCGEGADAIWLASRGWRVTAIDVSSVAIDRAQAAAARADSHVDWQLVGLSRMPLPPNGFDLVIAFYPALPKVDDSCLDALTAAVAAGGTLLVVHHAEIDRERAIAHGFDPEDYVGVDDVAAALAERPDEWVIDVRETRERDIAGGSGSHHTRDRVLRARRIPS